MVTLKQILVIRLEEKVIVYARCYSDLYDDDYVDNSSPTAENESLTLKEIHDKMIHEMRNTFRQTSLKSKPLPPEQSFIDPKLFVHLRHNSEQARNITEFFRMMAICHTVLAQKPDGISLKDLEYQDIMYKAQSPDEAALVDGARNLGFTFVTRESDTVVVDILGKKETYKILNVLEFNSSRKRMSVIIQKQSGEIVLLCKGADNIIYDRLTREQPELEADTLSHLESFAEEGLRTLCFAYRNIPVDEYHSWASRYLDACNSLKDREVQVDTVSAEIENGLLLIGATAIEDQLQEGVPECIEVLGRAGIKIWVLTGDKMETAINIGFSCNLLDKDMLLIVIKGTDADSVNKQIMDAYEQIWGDEHSDARTRLMQAAADAKVAFSDQQIDIKSAHMKNIPLALIIDGPSLKFALDESIREVFLELGCHCKAVICCRVSPLQKAKVVELVKNGRHVMTLAIGDGANDVSMIQVNK
jgi:phospholipid-translocating ATPase